MYVYIKFNEKYIKFHKFSFKKYINLCTQILFSYKYIKFHVMSWN